MVFTTAPVRVSIWSTYPATAVPLTPVPATRSTFSVLFQNTATPSGFTVLEAVPTRVDDGEGERVGVTDCEGESEGDGCARPGSTGGSATPRSSTPASAANTTVTARLEAATLYNASGVVTYTMKSPPRGTPVMPVTARRPAIGTRSLTYTASVSAHTPVPALRSQRYTCAAGLRVSATHRMELVCHTHPTMARGATPAAMKPGSGTGLLPISCRPTPSAATENGAAAASATDAYTRPSNAPMDATDVTLPSARSETAAEPVCFHSGPASSPYTHTELPSTTAPRSRMVVVFMFRKSILPEGYRIAATRGCADVTAVPSVVPE